MHRCRRSGRFAGLLRIPGSALRRGGTQDGAPGRRPGPRTGTVHRSGGRAPARMSPWSGRTGWRVEAAPAQRRARTGVTATFPTMLAMLAMSIIWSTIWSTIRSTIPAADRANSIMPIVPVTPNRTDRAHRSRRLLRFVMANEAACAPRSRGTRRDARRGVSGRHQDGAAGRCGGTAPSSPSSLSPRGYSGATGLEKRVSEADRPPGNPTTGAAVGADRPADIMIGRQHDRRRGRPNGGTVIAG
jgi:hypothetical protein